MISAISLDMQLPKIPLFDWLIDNFHKAKYDLAMNSITGVKLAELIDLTDFEIPQELNLGFNDPFGAAELREVLAKMYNCEQDQIITTTGGSEANFLVFLALLNSGDEVIVEQPSYSPLWLVPEMFDANVLHWPRRFENDFGLDLEALKNKITKRTKLIVITNLHNPSGVLADRETIRAVAEIAADNNALLLIDEMFLDSANKPERSAVGLDSVIVTASVSKVYGIGGMRTGWIIADEDIVKQCLLAKWQTTVASPYFSEILIATALAKARDKLVQRCKDIAARNFPIVREWIEGHENLLAWVEPAGGIMSYPRFNAKSKINSVQLGNKLLDEKGVLISPGEYFGLEGHFRLTYKNPVDELRAGLNLITEVLKEV